MQILQLCTFVLQQYDQALEAATRCAACDPNWLKGYIRLAEVHRTMGNDDLALEVLGDQVLEKDPDNEVATRMADEMLKKKFEKFDAQVEEEKHSPPPRPRAPPTTKVKGWVWSIGVSFSSILLLHLMTGNGALVFQTCVYMLLQFFNFLDYVGSIHSDLPEVLEFFLVSAIVFGWQKSQGPKRWRILRVVRLGVILVATSFLCAKFIDWRAEQLAWDNGKYYQVLDAPKNATAKAIKAGYHSQAMIHHPDRVKRLEGDSADAFEKKIKRATEKFVEIELAYSILSNKAKKEVYDGCGLFGMEAMNRGICEEKDFRQCCDKVREILSTNQYQDYHSRPPPPHYQPHEF